MKKRILLIPLVLLLAMSLVATGCPAPVEVPAEIAELEKEVAAEKAKVAELEGEIAALKPPAPAEVIEWRMWQVYAVYHREPLHKRAWNPPWGYEQVAAKILEDSGGRLKLRVCLAPELGLAGPDMPRALKDGLVEVSEIFPSFVNVEIPWFAIYDLPFIINDIVEHAKMLEALHPYHEEFFAEYNSTLLADCRFFPGLYLGFYTDRPISRVEDLKGLKIRMMSPYHKGTLEKAGASAVFMPYGEVAMALKTGVIDGLMTGMGAGTICKSHETGQTYETACWPYPLAAPVGVGNEALNSLPPDLKEVFLNAWDWFKNEQDARAYNILFYEEMLEMDRSLGYTCTGPQPELWDKLKSYAMETDWVTYEEKAGAKGTEVLNTVLQALGRPRK